MLQADHAVFPDFLDHGDQDGLISIVWHGLYIQHIDGLVQERRNSIANALELRLSWTNPSIQYWTVLP